MNAKLTGLGSGIVFGFVLAWARVTDPLTIRRMLLLQEADVFLLMGSAVIVAAIGVRLVRRAGMPSIISRDRIRWSNARPAVRHLLGSAIFGLGWTLAATCPGPMLAMIGQGRVVGLFIGAGVLIGAALQGAGLARAATVGSVDDQPRASTCV